MIVAEIYEDATKILGTCDEAEVLRKISRAISEMANMAQWDWMLRTMSLNVESPNLCSELHGYVTLPSWIETALAITLDGSPTFPRDRWFRYHLNGPGDCSAINCFRRFWDDYGEAYTIREISSPTTLIAANLSAADAAQEIRLYGLDENGNQIYDSNGKEGIALVMNVASTVQFSKITGVYRPIGAGVITLTDTTNGLMVGYYYPNETNPKYRRIRVPKRCRTVTIQYRVSTLAVTSQEDWIPLWNTNAMLQAIQYIYHLDKRMYQDAETARAMARRSLTDEQDTRNAQSPVGPQIQNFSNMPPDRLTFGYGGGWGASGTGGGW